MPDPKHQSVTSSTYSGNSESVRNFVEQPVKKIEKKAMTDSAEEAQRKRRENKAQAAARRLEEAKQK